MTTVVQFSGYTRVQERNRPRFIPWASQVIDLTTWRAQREAAGTACDSSTATKAAAATGRALVARKLSATDVGSVLCLALMVAAVFGTLATFAPRPVDAHGIDRVADPFTIQQPYRS